MKKLLMTIFTMLAAAGNALAEDRFTVADVNTASGNEFELTVEYSLDAGTECSGYSFWLRLPVGYEFVLGSKGLPAYTLGEVYKENAPTFSQSFDDGFLKVVCVNNEQEPLEIMSGALVTYKVKRTEGITVSGEFAKGWLIKGYISAYSGASRSVEDITFLLDAPAATKGDANGDGAVTITDAVSIVNYILGSPAIGFNFDAADVNGDKSVTITDAVGVVNIILGQSDSSAPALSAPMLMDGLAPMSAAPKQQLKEAAPKRVLRGQPMFLTKRAGR